MAKRLFKYKKSSPSGKRSKGARLGWVSLKDVKRVKLEDTLTKREEVQLDDKHSPLLVP